MKRAWKGINDIGVLPFCLVFWRFWNAFFFGERQRKLGWWFQTFLFSPWGNDSIWLVHIFSNGCLGHHQQKTPEFSSFVFASRLRRKNLSLMRRYRHQEWIIGKKWLLLSLNPLKLWPVVSRDLCSFEHRGHFSEEPVKWQGHERESMILVYLLSVWYFGIFWELSDRTAPLLDLKKGSRNSALWFLCRSSEVLVSRIFPVLVIIKVWSSLLE